MSIIACIPPHGQASDIEIDRFADTAAILISIVSNREFTKLLRQLQGKRHIRIELCLKLSLLLLFHVDHFVQNRRTALSLAWNE